MPSNTYRKPKGKVIEVYRDKELNHQVEYALLNLFANQKVAITPKKVQRFLNELAGSGLGSESVLIIEQFPLSSLEAHGKFERLVYSKVSKTGNQYTRRHVIPTNPKTPSQDQHRNKYKQVVANWNKLTKSQKEPYNLEAQGAGMSGYNLYVKKNLKGF